jgi:transposase InsO family protein
MADAYPLRSTDHAELCRAFLTWFTTYGIPATVHTDQGANFMAGPLQEAYRQLRVRRSRTTAYHPQADPAERVIGSLVRPGPGTRDERRVG